MLNNKTNILYLKLITKGIFMIGILPFALTDLIINDVLDLLYIFPYRHVAKPIIALDMIKTYIDEIRQEGPLDLVNVKTKSGDDPADIRISTM